MSKWGNKDFKTVGKTIMYSKQKLRARLEVDKSLKKFNLSVLNKKIQRNNSNYTIKPNENS